MMKLRAQLLMPVIVLLAAPAQSGDEVRRHDWRPLVYGDLSLPTETSRAYAEVWSDHLRANNEFYRARGDRRFVVGNAPAAVAHFVVRSPSKVVTLSVLNTVSGCGDGPRTTQRRINIRQCPMRLAVYGPAGNHVFEAGRACFLEQARQQPGLPDETPSGASYAAYDAAARAIRLGVVLDGQGVEGCDLTVPIPTGR